MRKPKAHEKKPGLWEAKGIDPSTRARKSYYGSTAQEASDKAHASFIQDNIDTLYGFYANVYLPTIMHRSQNWRSQVAWAMDGYIIPKFGHLPLASITRKDAQSGFNTWGRTELKPSSLARMKIVWSCVMNLAVADDVIPKNPVALVRLPTPMPATKRALTINELAMLIHHSQGRAMPVVLLCGVCGLRIGEATGVTRKALTSEGLMVLQQVLQPKGGAVVSDTLKTPQSLRIIPLPAGLREALIGAGQVSHVWICSDSKGGFLTPNNATRELQEAAAKAKLGKLTPHELRHSFISILENELEAPQRIVESLAGKAKQGNTASYNHMSLAPLERWMTKLWDQVSTAIRQIECRTEAEILNLA